MDENSFDSRSDQLILLVVEVYEIDRAQITHVKHPHNVAKFIEEDELELGRND